MSIETNLPVGTRVVTNEGARYEIVTSNGSIAHRNCPSDAFPAYFVHADGTKESDVVYADEIVRVLSTPQSSVPLDDRDVWNAAAAEFAKAHDAVLEFSYQKRDGLVSRRVIEPVRIDYEKQLIEANDLDRDAFRAFRLDRIVGYVTIKH